MPEVTPESTHDAPLVDVRPPDGQTWMEAAETRPWVVVMAALAYQAASQPVPEDLREGSLYAAMCVTAVFLSDRGASIDALDRLFARDFTVHLAYDRSTDEVSLSLDFEDGTSIGTTHDSDARDLDLTEDDDDG